MNEIICFILGSYVGIFIMCALYLARDSENDKK